MDKNWFIMIIIFSLYNYIFINFITKKWTSNQETLILDLLMGLTIFKNNF